jgi:hypothetical protein
MLSMSQRTTALEGGFNRWTQQLAEIVEPVSVTETPVTSAGPFHVPSAQKTMFFGMSGPVRYQATGLQLRERWLHPMASRYSAPAAPVSSRAAQRS